MVSLTYFSVFSFFLVKRNKNLSHIGLIAEAKQIHVQLATAVAVIISSTLLEFLLRIILPDVFECPHSPYNLHIFRVML